MTGLRCRFGGKADVADADLAIEPGRFVGVIGGSHAGKATLLRTINRLQTPTAGHEGIGQHKLASRIMHVSSEMGDGAGFDILSFHPMAPNDYRGDDDGIRS